MSVSTKSKSKTPNTSNNTKKANLVLAYHFQMLLKVIKKVII